MIFRQFKSKMLKTFSFCHFDRKKQCFLKIDFSNIVNDEILSQEQNDDMFYFILFFLKNINSVEFNYEIYNKKFLTIIRCFEQ